MSLIPYTANIIDEDSGLVLIPDIECELDVDVDFSGDEPEIDITAVWMVAEEPLMDRIRRKGPDGKIPAAKMARVNLLVACETHLRHIALEVMDQAEDCPDFRSRVLAAEGITFVGHPSDPDAHYKRVLV